MVGNKNLIQALILDMDGVLWRGDEPIGKLREIFSLIDAIGWKVSLATNNATLSVSQYSEKLSRFGVHLSPQQIVNSAQATAHFLQKRFPAGGQVYVIGEKGLVDTLEESGFSCPPIHLQEIKYPQNKVIAVVVALDRQVTFEKLTIASRLIRSGALFLGTNPDPTYPSADGLIPGAGALIAAIQVATDTKPFIIGKPFPEMYQVALERMQVSPQNCLVVGDRLETDIAGGQQIGCQTALVLSGVASLQAAQRWQPAPDWISPDLTHLLAELAQRVV